MKLKFLHQLLIIKVKQNEKLYIISILSKLFIYKKLTTSNKQNYKVIIIIIIVSARLI